MFALSVEEVSFDEEVFSSFLVWILSFFVEDEGVLDFNFGSNKLLLLSKKLIAFLISCSDLNVIWWLFMSVWPEKV